MSEESMPPEHRRLLKVLGATVIPTDPAQGKACKEIVVIVASSTERYLSLWAFRET